MLCVSREVEIFCNKSYLQNFVPERTAKVTGIMTTIFHTKQTTP